MIRRRMIPLVAGTVFVAAAVLFADVFITNPGNPPNEDLSASIATLDAARAVMLTGKVDRVTPSILGQVDMNGNDITEANRIYGGSGVSGTMGIDIDAAELQANGTFDPRLNWSNQTFYGQWTTDHASSTGHVATLGNVNTAVGNLSNTMVALATPVSFTFGHENVQTNTYDIAAFVHESVVITQIIAYTHFGSNDLYFAKRGVSGLNPSNLSSMMWLDVSGVAETTGTVQTVNWTIPANWFVSATVSNSWGSTNLYIQLRGAKN